MALMDEGDADYDYSVAFVDLMARGRATGRAVLTRGRFARADEVPGDEASAAPTTPACWSRAPPGVPSGLLNRLSVPALNEVWYRKSPALPPRRAADHPHLLPPARHGRPLEPHVRTPRASCSGSTPCPSAPRTWCATPSTRLSASGYHHRSWPCSSASAPATPARCRSRCRAGRWRVDIPVGRAGLGPLLDELDEPGGGGRRAASTWPRTAGCAPSCWRPCTPGWTSGEPCAAGDPDDACAATWLAAATWPRPPRALADATRCRGARGRLPTEG